MHQFLFGNLPVDCLALWKQIKVYYAHHLEDCNQYYLDFFFTLDPPLNALVLVLEVILAAP